MKNKKILYVSSEVVPYLPETEISSMSFEVPRMINKQGGQIRIFMPKYGSINERRHQLHEVIRLSGLNLVIDDLDMPLIIKVASIPKERIQVYFIDNEDYFKRKGTYKSPDGQLFKDNDERAIFFAKGVLSTIKRLNWAPDIIHVHGWLSAFVPLYLRETYKDEPTFQNSKVITSIYGTGFAGSLNKKLLDKILFDEIEKNKIIGIKTPNYNNLMKIAIDFSDGLIVGSEKITKQLEDYINKSKKPVLEFQEKDAFGEKYIEFYNKLLN